jgi:hypothetical protein
VAHETKFGLLAESPPQPETPGAESKDGTSLMHVYEAPDGFRGTYEEVVAHEKKLDMKTGNETFAGVAERHEQVLLRIYEAPDGFRGT